jgi:hypothetical protein
MIISDLSYLESASTSTVEGGDNYAYVDQYAKSSAGNNSGYFNRSYFNKATSANVSYIYQDDSDYYKKYYRSYW